MGLLTKFLGGSVGEKIAGEVKSHFKHKSKDSGPSSPSGEPSPSSYKRGGKVRKTGLAHRFMMRIGIAQERMRERIDARGRRAQCCLIAHHACSRFRLLQCS